MTLGAGGGARYVVSGRKVLGGPEAWVSEVIFGGKLGGCRRGMEEQSEKEEEGQGQPRDREKLLVPLSVQW
jgi:hypothetical protein